jgi:hypothetical protein
VAAVRSTAHRAHKARAIQERDRIVVIHDAQIVPDRRLQPGRQLVSVTVAFIGVVGIQKRDPLDLVGDAWNRVDVAEDEASPAAIASKRDARASVLESLNDRVEDPRNLGIPILAPPCRPALQVVLQVCHTHPAILDRRP